MGLLNKVRPFEVAVQTLGGNTPELTMDNTARRTVGDLKAAIGAEQRKCTSHRLQELFSLDESNDEQGVGGEKPVNDVTQQAMLNHDIVEHPFALWFCV
jgi:hypothetical protein